MTPPDFDLTTVEGIVRTVEAMQFARKVAESRAPTADDWATEAAHHARRLQGVAELVQRLRPGAVVVGEIFRCDDGRLVRVSGMPDGATLCRDHQGRVAVRNVSTGRLSYLPEGMLKSMPRVSPCEECEGTKTSGERAEDGAPLVCTACQGGRRP